jgi:hypothetical protein
MGDIVVPADTEGLQDGDLLCHLLHPHAGATLNAKPPAAAAPANGMQASPFSESPANLGGGEYQTMPQNKVPQVPANHSPGFDFKSQTPKRPVDTTPVPLSQSDLAPPVVLDASLYTREMPIRMPNMGKYDGSYSQCKMSL